MSALSMGRRKKSDDATPTGEPEAGGGALLIKLVKLLDELSRLEFAGGPPVDAAAGPADHGDDDNHVYLWLNLHDRTGPDIDINLHGKTLMVRVDKNAPPGTGGA